MHDGYQTSCHLLVYRCGGVPFDYMVREHIINSAGSQTQYTIKAINSSLSLSSTAYMKLDLDS